MLEAVELAKAKKEIQEKDAEIDREGKIAGVFCKAYEKAVLLDPTEENVRIWLNVPHDQGRDGRYGERVP